jgi:type III pantothenate kinase
MVDGCTVGVNGEINTKEVSAAMIEKLMAEHGPTGVAVASVVPAVSQTLEAFLKNCGTPVQLLRHDKLIGLGFDYPKPAEVGQDRLADCIGAQVVCGAPAVIIGMGTATTVDILTEKGYAGGIIAPGMGLMTQYLHERTALLPALDVKNLLGGPAIGKSTVDAMRSGCALGFAGMIGALLDGVVAELMKSGSPAPKVIVTGGAAIYLPAAWKTRVQYEPHLALIGLAEFYRRTQK